MGEKSSTAEPAGLQVDRDDGLVFLTLIEPPAGFSQGDLAELERVWAEIRREAGLSGIVLVLQGGHRQSAALSGELGRICNQVETCPLPVVAVLPAGAGGATWALALAAHYRIGGSGLRVVMSEARHGQLPGAGVTQRLARLVGAAEILRMILGTRPEPGAELMRLGALDQIVSTDPVEVAIRFLKTRPPPRRSRDAVQGLQDPRGFLAEIRAHSARLSNDPLDIFRVTVRAVEAALLLPFENGLALESVLVEDMAAAPETRAFAHAQRAETHVRQRQSLLADTVRPLRMRPVERLGLWRGGAARADLVAQVLMAGIDVVLADPAEAGLAALGTRVLQVLGGEASLDPAEREAMVNRLRLADGVEGFAGCDLVLADEGDLPAIDVPVVMLGHWPGLWEGWNSLSVPRRGFDHAEIGISDRAEALSGVPRVLDLARRLRWRLHMVGPSGFIEPALRQAQRLTLARLAELGHKGAVLTAGMALAGIGSSRYGPGQKVLPSVRDVADFARAALANEGARLIEEGIAASALDVDAAAVASGIMPRWAGGPLYQADLRGLILLRADLQRLGGAGRLAPAAYLEDLISAGGRFYPHESP